MGTRTMRLSCEPPASNSLAARSLALGSALVDQQSPKKSQSFRGLQSSVRRQRTQFSTVPAKPQSRLGSLRQILQARTAGDRVNTFNQNSVPDPQCHLRPGILEAKFPKCKSGPMAGTRIRYMKCSPVDLIIAHQRGRSTRI